MYSVVLAVPVKDCNTAINLHAQFAQLAMKSGLKDFSVGIDKQDIEFEPDMFNPSN